MATKKTSETDQPVARVGDVPAYMLELVGQGQEDSSLDTMKHHKVLNRLAIIQSNSPREKKDKYGEATLCVPATDMVLARRGESFDVVPVMFFDEYITWADRKDKSGPMIQAKSMDIAGALAARCSDPARWREPYGDPLPDGSRMFRRHAHHFNFLCAIYSGENKGQLVVISLAKGSWKDGQTWIGLIRSRKVAGRQAPLYTTVWNVSVTTRQNKDGEWYVTSIVSAENPWAAEADIPSLKAMHEELKQQYRDSLLAVGHEAAEQVEEEPDLAANKDF